METPGNYSQSRTLEKIMDALQKLQEGDRVRILNFTLAIIQDRRGKRIKRRKRLQSPVIEDWRIGQ